MIRNGVIKTDFGRDPGFYWRGGEVSRIEGFSDGVFGFALTLLVISLNTPDTFTQLQETLSGFVVFAATFALFVFIWYDHYQYFRRFGLNDTYVIVLNFLLLFVVVFYVYPLKFLATVLVKMFSGESLNVLLSDGSIVKAIENQQWASMMIIYGIGFIVIYAIYFLLYLHAYKLRKILALSEIELVYTKGEMAAHIANCCIGVISISFVIIGGNGMSFYSGMTYWLIGLVQAVLGIRRGRKVRMLLTTSEQ